MNSRCIHRSVSSLLLSLAALSALPSGSRAALRTWDGGGTGEHWASNLPWENNTAPNAGDDLVWPMNGRFGATTDNDFPAWTTFRSLTIHSRRISSLGGVTDGWTHSGNPVFITNTVHVEAEPAPINTPTAVTRIDFPITFTGTAIHVLDSYSGQVVMTQPLNFGATNCTLRAIGDDDVKLVMQAPVAGTGELVLENADLMVANPQIGPITCDVGTIHHAGALGTAAAGTTVTGLMNYLPSVLSEPLEIRASQGSVRCMSPTPTTVTSTLTLVGQQSYLTFDHGGQFLGAVLDGGTGGSTLYLATYSENEPLILGGSAPNEGADFTVFLSGEIQLNKTAANAWGGNYCKLHGPTPAAPPVTVRWMRSDQLADSAFLMVEEESLADLNGSGDTIRELQLFGGEVRTGTGALSLTGGVSVQNEDPDGFPLVSVYTGKLRFTNASQQGIRVDAESRLEMTAGVLLAPGAAPLLRKSGEGELKWVGNATDLIETRIEAGTLDYQGNSPQMDVSFVINHDFQPGKFTGRSCTVRDLTGIEFVAPQTIEFEGGISQVRNVTLSSSTVVARTLNPDTMGHYGIASGTVNLAGAKLEIEAGFTLGAIGSEYIVIGKSSPGPVTGTLTNAVTGLPLAEGELITVQDWIVRFSYAGGDGNDVSLKLVSFVPEGLLRTWTGSGGDNLWTTDGNWDLGSAPGASCSFPAVTNRAAVHDFPPGTRLERVRVLADGYTFTGNQAGLLSGIETNYPAGQTNFNTPLILAGKQAFTARNNSRLRMSTAPGGTTELNGWGLRLVPLAAGASIEIGNAAAGSDPPAAITGAGSLSVEGPGEVHFNAPSTFTGTLGVLQGTARLKRSPLALGAGTAGTSVQGGATLSVEFSSGTLAEPLTLTGGTLRTAPGAGNTVTLSGGLNAPTVNSFLSVDSGQANVSGPVTGQELTRQGSGVLQFTGSAPLSLSNRLTLAAGTTILARSAGLNAATRMDAVNAGTVLRLGAADQLNAAVNLNGAVFDLNGNNETIPALDATDATITTGAGTLTCPSISTHGETGSTLSGKLALPAGGTLLNVANDDPADDITISAVISGTALNKTGEGTAKLTGTNTFSSLTVSQGALLVTGSNAAAVSLAGGMIGGTGSTGSLTSTVDGGIVSPGAGPGIFSSGNVAWNAATTFVAELNSSTPGTGHDQISVTGTVNLNNAALLLLPGSSFAGTAVIIANDGADAVTGTFAGLAQNATLAVGGKTLRISYTGGTGNDVTLTEVVSGTGNTKTWSGLGSNNQWTTAGNWVGGVAPVAGDDLVFPAGVTVKSCNNTYSAGTTFNSIRIADSSYGLAGNPVSLNAGIVFDYVTGLSSVAMDVTMSGPQSFTVLQGAQGVVVPNTAITTAGFPLTVHVDGAAGRLTLNLLAGTGGLTKTGPGGLTMNGNNWTGPVTLVGGETRTGILTGFGTGTSAISVQSGAELRFENIASGTFTRGITLSGKLEFASSPITLSGALSLPGSGARTVEVTGTTPALSGIISGSGGLRKTGTGSLTLSGSAANTFTGGATVAEGTLRLGKSSSQVALPGPVTVGDGTGADILLYTAANQIGNTAAVILNGSGAQVQCSTFSDTIGSLDLTGGSVTGSGVLTVSSVVSRAAATTASIDVNLDPGNVAGEISIADGAASPDLQINGEWQGGPELTVDRAGEGTLLFSGGTAGLFKLNAGLTSVSRGWPDTEFVLNGGSLGGEGPVRTITGNGAGSVQPGFSPGILECDSFTGGTGVTLTMEIGGPTAGTQHDQLRVTGVADPQDAALELIALPGFVPFPGQQLTLVNNPGTDRMRSEFFKLPEGSSLVIAGATAQITYGGGDGNDVVLTITSINSTGVTRVWDGGGANGNWTSAANWVDDIAPSPGDTLSFPTTAPNKLTVNDYPAGTNFHRLIVGGGFVLSGNSILLNNGIVRGSGTAPATVELAIIMTGPQTFQNPVPVTMITIFGAVTNSGHALTFENANTATTVAEGVLSGSGPLVCNGGSVTLKTTPAITGSITLNGTARLNLQLLATLGSASSVTVNSGSSLQVLNSTATVTITQPITLRGTLQSSIPQAIFTGTINLPDNAPATLSVFSGSLSLRGRIQGIGGITQFGTAPVLLEGTQANTFTGGWRQNGGTLVLNKPAGVTALPGPVSIINSPPAGQAVVRWMASNQVADTAIFNRTRTVDLNGFSDTIAGLVLGNTIVTTGAGTLTLTGNVTTQFGAADSASISGNLAFTGAGVHQLDLSDTSAPAELTCSAAITTAPGATLRKTGTGTATFTGASAAVMEIADGTVNWNASAPASFLTVNGGTLNCTGAFQQCDSLPAGGIFSPGGDSAAGTVSAQSIHLNPDVTVRMQLNSATPGSGYDQILIADGSTLDGAALDLTLGFAPAMGQSFTLIDSAGAGVTTPFAGLPEGSHFDLGGHTFSITYAGGSGGDTIITKVDPPAPVITSHSFVPGTGGEAGQTVLNMSVTGTQGLNYFLESSADMVNWTLLQTVNAGPGGTVTFRALQADTEPRVFLRTRRQ